MVVFCTAPAIKHSVSFLLSSPSSTTICHRTSSKFMSNPLHLHITQPISEGLSQSPVFRSVLDKHICRTVSSLRTVYLKAMLLFKVALAAWGLQLSLAYPSNSSMLMLDKRADPSFTDLHQPLFSEVQQAQIKQGFADACLMASSALLFVGNSCYSTICKLTIPNRQSRATPSIRNTSTMTQIL
jgi:hypothetical protein